MTSRNRAVRHGWGFWVAMLLFLGAGPLFAIGVGPAMAKDPAADSQPEAGSARKPTYLLIPVKGTIGQSFTADKMKDLLDEGLKSNPTVVVLDLDTPGGNISDAEKAVNLIIAHKEVRFVALVHRALSAGATITMACKEIYVTEGATVGAAVSFMVGADGMPVALPPDIKEKMQSAWRAVCRKAADHGGHSSLLAESMVDPDFALTLRKDGDKVTVERDGKGDMFKAKGRILTMTAREAVACGLANAMVGDLAELGRTLFPAAAAWTVQAAGPVAPGKEYDSLAAVLADMPKDLFPAHTKDAAWTDLAADMITKSAKEKLPGQSCVVSGAWTKGDLVDTHIMVLLTMPLTYGGWTFDVGVICRFDASNTKLAQMKEKAVVRVHGKLGGFMMICKGAIRIGRKDSPSPYVLAGSPAKPAICLELDNCEIGDAARAVSPPPSTTPPSTTPPGPVAPPTTPPPSVAAAEQKATEQLNLAESYKAANMIAKAKEILATLLKTYPQTKAAEQAKKKLEELGG